MSILKTECPSCGAAISINDSTCLYCGTIFQIKKEKNKKAYDINFGREINVKGKIESIQTIVKEAREKNELEYVSKYSDSLFSSKSGLIDLNGLEEFKNLSTIHLWGNNIEVIKPQEIEHLEYLISKSFKFIILLKGNNGLDFKSVLNQIVPDKIKPKNYINLRIPNKLSKLLDQLEFKTRDCSRNWNRSENAMILKKQFKNYKNYLNRETFSIKEEIRDAYEKWEFDNRIKFETDIDPFENGINGFYEGTNNIFYKYIALPDKKIYLGLMKKRYSKINFDFIANYKEAVDKYRKQRKLVGAIGCLGPFVFLYLVGAAWSSMFIGWVIFGIPLYFIMLWILNRWQSHPSVKKEISKS